MADEPRDIVLEYLRRIDRRMESVAEDVKSLGTRMLSVEKHLAAFHTAGSDQMGEIARLKVRVDRIEQRLELAP